MDAARSLFYTFREFQVPNGSGDRIDLAIQNDQVDNELKDTRLRHFALESGEMLTPEASAEIAATGGPPQLAIGDSFSSAAAAAPGA